ncbi:MAG: hypothetical protein FRX49_00112 [Trebouxia sp. A1-2]|nr:MAG: hypothetical protein FRX49_00112 [Trebouxia sp. A1-2]
MTEAERDGKGPSATGAQAKSCSKIEKFQTVCASGAQHGIITHLMYEKKCRHFFAACLDDTLKLYSQSFRLQASFRWHGGVVISMVYNAAIDELMTIGRNGVKAWYCEPDYKAFAKNAAAPLQAGSGSKLLPGNSATSMSKLKGGKAAPWELGAFQSIHERVTFRVPGANQHRVPKSAGLVKQADWCQQAFLQEELQVLHVPIKGSVYGFRIDNGERIYNWEGLHKQLVTAVVHHPGSNHIITGSHDMTAKLWALGQNGELQLLNMFAQTASPVQSITLHPSKQSILMAVTDGTISLWQLDTLGELYRYKHEGRVEGLTFTDADDFYFFSGPQVCAMHLQHLFTTFRSCNSQPRQLDLLEDNSLLMSFEDGCVRICDPASGKDTTITLPQLSIRSPRYVRADLAQRKLYVLMSNGHIHVWRLHAQRPPTLVAVWDKMTPNHKDLALCITLMPTGSLDPKLADLQGLAMTSNGECSDHVIVGTRAGDCLFLDAAHDGQVMLCFPAHRGDQIDLLEVDAGLQRMMTVSGGLLKVWNMKGHRLLKELRFHESLTHVEKMGEVVVLGGDAGGVHLVNMDTGHLLASPNMEDHDGPVTGLSAHMTLKHFISCGSDGVIKASVRQAQATEACYALLEPILSVSFLNDSGDIVAALDRKLVVIRADSYKFLTADEMSMLVTEHAKSMQQPLRQTPASALRAAMQLAQSGSTQRLQPAQQQHLSQAPETQSQTDLSAQLSMAQPDMLLELQRFGSDTKLSIFDDFTTKADISQAGVVSKVATAVKGWQRYKYADSQTQHSAVADAAAAGVRQSVQDNVTGSDSGMTAGPDSRSLIVNTAEQAQTSSSAEDMMPTVTSDSAAVSLAIIPAKTKDDTSRQISAGMAIRMLSESGSGAGSSAASRKVGFAEPAREEVEESGNTSLTDSGDVGTATTEAQQATAADLRARVAAGMRRAAAVSNGTPSLHGTLRRLNKELTQKEQAPRHTALPCFSFNKRGALVKTMSRKHSTVSQQSATDGVLPSARGLHLAGSLASQRTQSGLTASSHSQTLSRQQSSQQDVSTQQASQQQGTMQPRSPHIVALLPEAALASIPEEELAAVQKVKKVVKKKRRRKLKKGSRVTQPSGMTDQEKSIWLLEHCKVGEVIAGLLDYQEAVTMTRSASKGLAVRTEHTAANTPASPIQSVKPPRVFQNKT